MLGDSAATAATAGLVAAADLGEALERNGNGEGAQQAFREVLRRGRSPDAALGLLRTASVARDFTGVVDALRAVGDMSFDESGATIAAAATREADLLDTARAQRPAPATARADAGGAVDADDAFGDWLDGVRRDDHRQVAGAFVDLARLAGGSPAAAAHAVGAGPAAGAGRRALAARGTRNRRGDSPPRLGRRAGQRRRRPEHQRRARQPVVRQRPRAARHARRPRRPPAAVGVGPGDRSRPRARARAGSRRPASARRSTSTDAFSRATPIVSRR